MQNFFTLPILGDKENQVPFHGIALHDVTGDRKQAMSGRPGESPPRVPLRTRRADFPQRALQNASAAVTQTGGG